MSVTPRYEPVIGLEVHCQLKTASKMFSPCGFEFGATPNSWTDPYTLGLPGTLPVPNAEAVEFAIALALTTDSRIHPTSRFARKHYFYPDLPKGYQITQSDHPYATGGRIRIPATGEREAKSVRLVRIHLEEDAGKNTHVPGEAVSLVDYNRAGVPLLEIVSEPDIRSAGEAADYMRELRSIVRSLGISDANMAAGTLRCDANVSLRPQGTEAFGTRCEIKNLNSFKFLEQAIEAEIDRQRDILEAGGEVRQATLSFDPDQGAVRVMRTKEEMADYRYFPDPDLPPLVIDAPWIERVRSELPPLPVERRARYQKLGLSSDDVMLLSREPELGTYFDAMLSAEVPATQACNWLTVELLGRLNADGRTVTDSPVPPRALAELVTLVEEGTVSRRSAKDVFAKAYEEGGSPRAIAERDGYRQLSDSSELEAIVGQVLESSEKQLEQYKAGKTNLKGWFVGQVMKRTRGRANPKLVNEILERRLPKVEET